METFSTKKVSAVFLFYIVLFAKLIRIKMITLFNDVTIPLKPNIKYL